MNKPEAHDDWFEKLLEFRKSVPLSDDAADLAIASIREHRDAVPEWLQEMIDRKRQQPD